MRRRGKAAANRLCFVTRSWMKIATERHIRFVLTLYRSCSFLEKRPVSLHDGFPIRVRCIVIVSIKNKYYIINYNFSCKYGLVFNDFQMHFHTNHPNTNGRDENLILV